MSLKTFYIVDSDALPDVFKKVVEVKELLESGTAKNISAAIKMCGLSRSAFYKYKDSVFKAQTNDPEQVELQAVLVDRAGVLSAVSNAFFEGGANIITVNQKAPKNGFANVTFVIGTESLKNPLDELIKNISNLDGVISVKML